VLSELDITERRVPRTDVSRRSTAGGRSISASRSCEHFGEDAVLRVLDKQSLYESTQQQLSLDSLGSNGRHRRCGACRTSPTACCSSPAHGSGKTTTLYAPSPRSTTARTRSSRSRIRWNTSSRRAADSGQREKGSPSRGPALDLRHDPDKIMVARYATGNGQHRGAIGAHRAPRFHHRPREQRIRRDRRFMHMNVDLFGFVSALNAILRSACAAHLSARGEDTKPDAALLKESGLTRRRRPRSLSHRRGCRECRGSATRDARRSPSS